MRKVVVLLLACFVINGFVMAQPAQRVVVVTLDGYRWQELFGGADSLLTYDTAATYNEKYVQHHFWASTVKERREKLMPFFWSEIAKKGMILGNRNLGNKVNNANPYWFSYPGYNEIFTGYPDTNVNSNDKIPNPNINVFEFMHGFPQYRNKVAVFGSWDVFASIYNEKRSGIMVNDGFRQLDGKQSPALDQLNQLQQEMPDLFHGGERLDVATFYLAMEYLKQYKPLLFHIGLGDTDEFAHAGQYDYYLDAAQKTDAWIKKLWDYLQQDTFYKGKTTLLITTDHGRGTALKGEWKHHGANINGAGEIWIAAIGAGVPAIGESAGKDQFYQGQVAATIARLLGKEFVANHPVLPALPLNAMNH